MDTTLPMLLHTASMVAADSVDLCAALAPMATTLSFQPWHALFAGMSLGVLSMGRVLIGGRVLGISGIVKGLLAGRFETWRNLFVIGLVASGFVATGIMPGAFDTLPDSYSYARAIAAGLMVGAGSTLGNGCTSGHGISGNARLSLRSFAYTCTFFVAGIVACVLGETVSALGVAQSAPNYVALHGASAERAMTLIVTAVAGVFGFGAVAYKTKKQGFSVLFDLFAGLTFGLALCFSGMTRPTLVRFQHVATALAALQPAWNFTLFFVMGGALLVATPFYHLAIRKRGKALDSSVLDLPKSTTIDAQLLLGGVLFGAGWGLGGMCPGPAVVALASAQPQGMALVGAMLAGMAAVQQWQRKGGDGKQPRVSTG